MAPLPSAAPLRDTQQPPRRRALVRLPGWRARCAASSACTNAGPKSRSQQLHWLLKLPCVSACGPTHRTGTVPPPMPT